jgi:uncharacterized membrane protein
LKELRQMTTRYFVLAAGVVYAVAGACGFVFGTFRADLALNLLHLGLGVWGVMAYASRPAARGYSRRLAVAAAVLTLMALLPAAPRATLGLAPPFNDFWLHAITVVVAGYFGWGRRRQTAAYERKLRRAA